MSGTLTSLLGRLGMDRQSSMVAQRIGALPPKELDDANRSERRNIRDAGAAVRLAKAPSDSMRPTTKSGPRSVASRERGASGRPQLFRFRRR
jgi:hypothetical protein